jgi:hypothetical protein
MPNDEYEEMKYGELKSIYTERCKYLWIDNPSIPKKTW